MPPKQMASIPHGTTESPVSPPVTGSVGFGEDVVSVLDGAVGPVDVGVCSTVVVVSEEGTVVLSTIVVVLVPSGTLDVLLGELVGGDDVDVVSCGAVVVDAIVVGVVVDGVLVLGVTVDVVVDEGSVVVVSSGTVVVDPSMVVVVVV